MAEELEIRISKEGDTFIPFYPVSFSEFVWNNVLPEDEKHRRMPEYLKKYNVYPDRVFCG